MDPQQVHNSDGSDYLDSVEQVVGRYLHTCALKTDNTVHCWGQGEEGQLGYGVGEVLENKTRPVEVAMANLAELLPTVPEAPTSLDVAPVNSKVTLSWGTPNDGGSPITEYQYQQIESGESWGSTWISIPDSGVSGTNKTSYKVPDLTVGTTYTFRLRAVNEVGEGSPGSHEASILVPTTVPNPPENLKATPSDSKFFLTWDPPSDGGSPITEYRMQRKNGNQSWGNWWSIPDSGVGEDSEKSFSPSSNINNGAVYKVRLRAVNSNGQSANSAEISVTPGTPPLYEQKVAAGSNHSCALEDADQSGGSGVLCWGKNDYGQLGVGDLTVSVINGALRVVDVGESERGAALAEVTQVSSGENHLCALKNDKTVVCWGAGDKGQLGHGADTKSYTPQVVVDSSGTGVLSNVKQITAGERYSCALKDNATVWCWGYNSSGQLGNNSQTNSSIPVQVVGEGNSGTLSNIAQISGGSVHTCALKNSGEVLCWGHGTSGRLGDGNTATSLYPVRVIDVGESSGGRPLRGIRQVSTGSFHACALTYDEKALCWGATGNGRLGIGESVFSSSIAVVVASGEPLGGTPWANVTQITTSAAHTCAVNTSNDVFCWGYNGSGRVGLAVATDDVWTPQPVYNFDGSDYLADVEQVSGGKEHTCALQIDNTVHCWGKGEEGQLGYGVSETLENKTRPVEVVIANTRLGIPQDFRAIPSNTKAFLAWEPTVSSSGPIIKYQYQRQNSDGTWPTTWSDIADSGVGEDNETRATTSTLSNGTVYTFRLRAVDGEGAGEATTGTSVTPSIPETYTEKIGAGQEHTCALKNPDQNGGSGVICWGKNDYGQLGVGEGLTVDSINGALDVLDVGESTGGAALSGITQLSAGSSHNCALKSDNTAVCWGKGENGRLGNGTYSNSFTPQAVVDSGGTGTLSNVKQIAAGSVNSCALKNDGTVWCWGQGLYGQLGNNNTVGSYVPVQVMEENGSGLLTDINQVHIGIDHVCALTNDGEALCWGNGSSGQLGSGGEAPVVSGPLSYSPYPLKVVDVGESLGGRPLRGIRQLAVGFYNTYALTYDQKVLSWGYGNDGRLGVGVMTSVADTYAPRVVVAPGEPLGGTPLTYITGIESGWNHACAVNTSGYAFCWGQNFYGELGLGHTNYVWTPQQVHNSDGASYLDDVEQVSGGSSYTCALKTDNTLHCWGRGDDGRLGYGVGETLEHKTRPVEVVTTTLGDILPPPIPSFSEKLSTGYGHTCHTTTSNEVRCWGYGTSGQLGDGMRFSSDRAVNVKTGSNLDSAQLSNGGYHSCSLSSGGDVKCWGHGNFGQLGHGLYENETIPVSVKDDSDSTLTGISQISSGKLHTCALNTDSEVLCWGYGDSGRLGSGATDNTNTATNVKSIDGQSNLTGISQVSAGGSHTCAIQSADGSVLCWGSQESKRLGNGQSSGSSSTSRSGFLPLRCRSN